MCRMLVRIAQRRFGPLAPALKQRIDDASLEQLERWTDRIIADATLEETFAD